MKMINYAIRALAITSVIFMSVNAKKKTYDSKRSVEAQNIEKQGEVTRAQGVPIPTSDLAANNLYVNKSIYANYITPVSSTIVSNRLVPDEKGTTCFSGNVGIRDGKKLLTNEINPMTEVKVQNRDGSTTITCVEDDNGTTCFSGNVAISEDKVLSVDLITPVRTVNGHCVPDIRCEAVTNFSGGIVIHDAITKNCIDPVVLSGQWVAPLRIRIPHSGSSTPSTSYIKLYFLGASSGAESNYDVLYIQDFYFTRSCFNSISEGPILRSCENDEMLDSNPINYDYNIDNEETFYDVYIYLKINTEIEGLEYNGCLCYELISCDDAQVTCSPQIPV